MIDWRDFPATSLRWLGARWQRILLLFIVTGGPLSLFGELAEDVWKSGALAWDEPILVALRHAATPPRDAAMSFVTRLGFEYGVAPLTVLLLVLFLTLRHVTRALFVVAAVGGALLMNQLAKLVFARARPELADLQHSVPGYSFPSGHAMGAMAFAVTLAALAWQTRARWPVAAIGAAFAAAVGFSRVYLGAHYPSDVLAGWAASAAWAGGLAVLLRDRLTAGGEEQL